MTTTLAPETTANHYRTAVDVALVAALLLVWLSGDPKGLAAKFRATVTKACRTVAVPDLLDPEGLGQGALADTCQHYGIPTPTRSWRGGLHGDVIADHERRRLLVRR